MESSSSTPPSCVDLTSTLRYWSYYPSKPFHQKSKENNLEQHTGVHLQHACSSLLRRGDRLRTRKSRSLVGGGSALGAKGERLPKLLPHARRERDQDKVRNLSSTYFSSLKMQDTDPDQFTAIRWWRETSFGFALSSTDKVVLRHNVISLVEGSPHKLCDQGWNFDHRNVFNTITSEVHLKLRNNNL